MGFVFKDFRSSNKLMAIQDQCFFITFDYFPTWGYEINSSAFPTFSLFENPFQKVLIGIIDLITWLWLRCLGNYRHWSLSLTLDIHRNRALAFEKRVKTIVAGSSCLSGPFNNRRGYIFTLLFVLKKPSTKAIDHPVTILRQGTRLFFFGLVLISSFDTAGLLRFFPELRDVALKILTEWSLYLNNFLIFWFIVAFFVETWVGILCLFVRLLAGELSNMIF